MSWFKLHEDLSHLSSPSVTTPAKSSFTAVASVTSTTKTTTTKTTTTTTKEEWVCFRIGLAADHLAEDDHADGGNEHEQVEILHDCNLKKKLL